MLNPEHEVLGLDVIPEAAPSARLVAEMLGVSNVSFETRDCISGLGDLPHDFAMATAFTFFGPALGLSSLHIPAESSYAEVVRMHELLVPPVQWLDGIVKEGGRLVTADRLVGAAPTWWTGVLGAAGYTLRPTDLAWDLQEPLVTFTARRAPSSSAPPPRLVLHYLPGPLAVAQLNGRVTFWLEDQGGGPVGVELDGRDLRRLAKALTRRHVDFTSKSGSVQVTRTAGLTMFATPARTLTFHDEPAIELQACLAAMAAQDD